jgi:plastocyanin
VLIAPGGTVTWSWSNAAQPHNIVGDGFGDPTLGRNGSYSFTFTQPGTYPFTCQSHSDTMNGEVIVQ